MFVLRNDVIGRVNVDLEKAKIDTLKTWDYLMDALEIQLLSVTATGEVELEQKKTLNKVEQGISKAYPLLSVFFKKDSLLHLIDQEHAFVYRILDIVDDYDSHRDQHKLISLLDSLKDLTKARKKLRLL